MVRADFNWNTVNFLQSSLHGAVVCIFAENSVANTEIFMTSEQLLP